MSVSSAGNEGNGPSSTPLGVTDDGRYVLFESTATNLVAGDTNGSDDLFRRDETTKTTVRVDVTSAGGQLAGGPNLQFGPSWAAMSADGRYVAFLAHEPLTAGGPARGVYVRDVTAGTTTLASVPPAGGFPVGGIEEIAMSADGRYVSFTYAVAGPPPPEGFGDILYRSDRQAGTTVALTDAGRTGELHASRDGKHYSLYPQCAHGCTTAPELLDADGSAAGWPALQFKLCWADDVTTFSPDGRFFAYTASGFLDTPGCLAKGRYLVDRATGAATPFTPGGVSAISRGGRAVLFVAAGDALPGGDPAQHDLYLRDRATGADAREDFTVAAQLPDAAVYRAVLSDDGTAVAFATPATNIVAGDRNGLDDVFVRRTGMAPSG